MKKIYVMLAAMLLMSFMACSSSGGGDGSAASSAKEVTAFSLGGVVGTIDEVGKTITITMPYGTDVTALTPLITVTGASVNPASGDPQDFSAPVDYTVTADDGSTEVYTVTVLLQAGSLPKTGQTTDYAAGDDGDLEMGVTWPDPWFTDNGDGTISDNLTGLMWTQDGNAPGPLACTNGVVKTWAEAFDHVECLNTNSYLGYNDWRLPNRKELKSLVNYGQSIPATWLNNASQGFSNVQSNLYWSSSTCADAAPANAWYINMSSGVVSNANKGSFYYVWPVRDGQFRVVDLPQTGQTADYTTGDDGDLQEGVAWPGTRFTNNSDGTISDNLTGLMWTQNGNAPGPPGCATGGELNTPDALTYIACLNTNSYLGYDDWRLPNVSELESLLHYGQSNPSTWLNTQGFSAQNDWYRSSTTNASNTSQAWVVMMGNGNVFMDGLKAGTDRVWPVRGGQ